MLKFILASLVVVVATLTMMSTARADIVSTTLDCSSTHDSYVQCDAGFSFTTAQLDHETVPGSCVYGSTWGTYDHFIWVHHNCSGRFTVSTSEAPVPAPTPSLPQVDCRFNTVNWQPYFVPTNHFIGRPNYGFADARQCAWSVQLRHSNAVCNWTGVGFTAYDAETNAQLFYESYATVEQCYAAVP